jgi:hypothetical protein
MHLDSPSFDHEGDGGHASRSVCLHGRFDGVAGQIRQARPIADELARRFDQSANGWRMTREQAIAMA